MSISQRDAVYEATLRALQATGIQFQPGVTNIKSAATSQVRKMVLESLCQQFREGKIALKDTPKNREKLSDDEKLKSYVSSLVSNHWKRDSQLNGSAGA